MGHEKKYEAEIIKRLEFLCPNIKDPQKEKTEKERDNLSRIETMKTLFSKQHRVLIEREFQEKGWEPIPQSKEDLIYMAALNAVIEETKGTN